MSDLAAQNQRLSQALITILADAEGRKTADWTSVDCCARMAIVARAALGLEAAIGAGAPFVGQPVRAIYPPGELCRIFAIADGMVAIDRKFDRIAVRLAQLWMLYRPIKPAAAPGLLRRWPMTG